MSQRRLWAGRGSTPPRLHGARGQQLKQPLSKCLERLSVKVGGSTRRGHPASVGLGGRPWEKCLTGRLEASLLPQVGDETQLPLGHTCVR